MAIRLHNLLIMTIFAEYTLPYLLHPSLHPQARFDYQFVSLSTSDLLLVQHPARHSPSVEVVSLLAKKCIETHGVGKKWGRPPMGIPGLVDHCSIAKRGAVHVITRVRRAAVLQTEGMGLWRSLGKGAGQWGRG